jgi:hypothetical protein
MSQDNPVADAIISDEELELDLTPDGTESPDEVATRLANAEKAKKQILARARKAEQELKALKEAQTPRAEPSKVDIDDEALDLRLDGYSKDEVKFILSNGGRTALSDPQSLVALALRTKREQTKAEESANIPDTSGMSEVERKYTAEQLNAMPLADLEKILPKTDN